jgi:hypothetical protein
MSLMHDIRTHMATAAGPLTPKDVAEALDRDPAVVRNAMYQAHTQGAGIERLDDGTYSLIIGWQPARGAGAATEVVPAPDRPEKKKPTRERKADRKKVTAKPKRAYIRNAKTPAPAPVVDSSRRTLSSEDELVPVRRGTLRALVHSVLESDSPVTPELRSALIQLTSVA